VIRNVQTRYLRDNRHATVTDSNTITFHISNTMPAGVPNSSGSTNPADTPYGHPSSFPSEDFPQYGGSKSIIYRSADGKIVAGHAKETGTTSLTYPCDEFFYVTEGWTDLKINGGESFRLNKGDFVYLTKGTTVDFVFGDGFANAAVFLDSERVTLI
jgi:uncharacterized cupin superfamily protein